MIGGRLFFKQIFRHAGREKRLSLGSFLVMLIILLLLDIFWVGSLNINYQYRELLSGVKMEIFLDNLFPEENLPDLRLALREFEGVSMVKYISAKEAALILTDQLGPGLIEGLDSNPLPRSFEIQFGKLLTLEQLDSMRDNIHRIGYIDLVEYQRPWIAKMEKIGNNLQIAGYIIGGVILWIVLLTTANTHRLTARSKSRDFAQLKLLGAGPDYLLYPFLAEGFGSTLIAALLGWAGIFYLASRISLANFPLLMPDLDQVVIFSLVAGLTGLAGAYLGIRKYFRS